MRIWASILNNFGLGISSILKIPDGYRIQELKRERRSLKIKTEIELDLSGLKWCDTIWKGLWSGHDQTNNCHFLSFCYGYELIQAIQLISQHKNTQKRGMSGESETLFLGGLWNIGQLFPLSPSSTLLIRICGEIFDQPGWNVGSYVHFTDSKLHE